MKSVLLAVVIAFICSFATPAPSTAGSQPSYGVVKYKVDEQISRARDALRRARDALVQATKKVDALRREADKTTDLKKKLALLDQMAAVLRTSVRLKGQINDLEASLEALKVEREALLTRQRLAEDLLAQRIADEASAAIRSAEGQSVESAGGGGGGSWGAAGSPERRAAAAELVERFLEKNDQFAEYVTVESIERVSEKAAWEFAETAPLLFAAWRQIDLSSYGIDNAVQNELFLSAIKNEDFLGQLALDSAVGFVSSAVTSAVFEYSAKAVVEQFIKPGPLAPYAPQIEALLVESLGAAKTVAGGTANPFSLVTEAFETGLKLGEAGVAYVEVSRINKETVEAAVAGAKLYLQLQQVIGGDGYRAAVAQAAATNQIAEGLMTDGQSVTVDTGRKLMLTASLLQLAARQEAGLATAADVDFVRSQVKEFANSNVSMFGRVSDATFLQIAKDEYTSFANRLAGELKIENWVKLQP